MVRLVGSSLALVLVLSACGGAATSDPGVAQQGDAQASPAGETPTPSPTPTPRPTPTAYWPLRGTIATDPATVRRRPIAVRIGNDPDARPVSGIAQADQVWELLTEGGITRYMAVFHSQEADSIGPVRSARLSDIQLAPMLRSILAHEGASQIVRQRVQAAAATGAFVEIDEWYWGQYFPRITTRRSPQTVYTSTRNVREAAAQAGAKDDVEVPFMVSTTVAPSGAEGSGATTFTVPYDKVAGRVTYAYDQGLGEYGGYTRTQGTAPTVDAATGHSVVATNVVIIHTDITATSIVEDALGSPSLDIRSTGTGAVTVFNRGNRYDGVWKRTGNDAYTFLVQPQSGGSLPIALVPGGTTYFHVVPNNWAVTSAP